MPIRAASDQGDIHAFLMDAESWRALKATYRDMNLRTPCCGWAAIPKTSSLGNFFFAHARRGECTTAPESQEHLYCKSVIAKVATEAGWTVTTERPGESPAGEKWVADVFCEKGNAKLAFEVQLAPQTEEETLQRQQRYKDSGVRCAWFFGGKAHKGIIAFDRETPAFGLAPITVGKPPRVAKFDSDLTEFVGALLSKHVAWTIPQYSRPHLVEYLEDTCWACRKPVKQVLDYMHGDSGQGQTLTPRDFYEGRFIDTIYSVANVSLMLMEIFSVIPNEDLVAQGLNDIGRLDVVKGKATKFPYCNLCLYCRAPQNNFYLSKKLQPALYSKPQDSLEVMPTFADFSLPKNKFGVATIPRVILGRGFWQFNKPDKTAAN